MRHAAVFVLAVLISTGSSVAADPTGAELYKAQCSRCHGADGSGSKKYKDALTGDKSVAQLAKVVQETMPESDPGTLTDAEAARIAAWMHETFYSPAARERAAPPRIELSRLTVTQYRNTVADLIASFRGPPKPSDARGLRGEYFSSRGFRDNARQIDRTDPEVAFDFGVGSPGEKLDPAAGFSVRWTGSIVAESSGEHEFIVRSDHAVKLYLNDDAKPLIDAWVKSGTDAEFRASAYLIAGRAYPVKLEFSKAKQGVDDKKKPLKPVPAFVKLEWRPPHQAAAVIAARHLSPGRAPESFAVPTPFPPDDRSRGWERGTSISKAWEQAATDAAVETAAYVSAKANDLAGTKDGATDRLDKIKAFARTFVARAFRRPLSPAEQRVYVDRHFPAGVDPTLAVRKMVILALKSPRFLYREVGGDAADGYAVAARLSYTLWDSLPDAELAKAAAAGQLKTPEQVRTQAERMAADPKAKVKLAGFVRHWLHVDHDPDISKSAKKYPAFDPAVVTDLRTSLGLFTADVLDGPDADFRTLLTSEEVYLNARLAKLYGVPAPAGGGFAKVKLDPGKRAGVLTHPYILSAFAYTAESSPIHRGVFLARGILGLTLKPPQEAFTPLAADLHPTLTTRQRVALQTQGAACQTCHAVINPLGFTLEQFDAIGRIRGVDNGKPVDATGGYLTRAGEGKTFADARGLAAYLADSPEVHDSFAKQLFHHLVQQPVAAYGPARQAELRDRFARQGFNVRKLAVDIAVTSAITPRAGPVAAVIPPKGAGPPGGN